MKAEQIKIYGAFPTDDRGYAKDKAYAYFPIKAAAEAYLESNFKGNYYTSVRDRKSVV